MTITKTPEATPTLAIDWRLIGGFLLTAVGVLVGIIWTSLTTDIADLKLAARNIEREQAAFREQTSQNFSAIREQTAAINAKLEFLIETARRSTSAPEAPKGTSPTTP